MSRKHDSFSIFTKTQKGNPPKKVYYYYVYDNSGKRLSRSTGETSLKKALDVIAKRIKDGELLFSQEDIKQAETAKRTLFKDFTQDFFKPGLCPICKELELRGKTVQPKVMRWQRQSFEKNILPYFGDKRVVAITVQSIRSWQADMKDTGVSNATVNRNLQILRKVMQVAEDSDIILRNPCRRVKPLFETDAKPRGCFTHEEIKRLFADEWDNPYVRLMCQIAACTGMRLGEIRALKLSSIVDGKIRIDSSYSADGEKSTKSGKVRWCPIPGKIELELLNICCRQASNEGSYIFTYDGIKPICSRSVSDALKRRMRVIGISGRTFHSFRHYFNSMLVTYGIPGDILRSVVGHSSELMTDRYLHLEISELDEVRRVQELVI